MTSKPKVDIDQIMKEGTAIDEAIEEGVMEAMKLHVKMGHPMVEWEDGKCVWVSPKEIEERIKKMTG